MHVYQNITNTLQTNLDGLPKQQIKSNW